MKQKINLSQIFVTLGILIVLLIVFLVEVFLGGSENVNVLMKMGAMVFGVFWGGFGAVLGGFGGVYLLLSFCILVSCI